MMKAVLMTRVGTPETLSCTEVDEPEITQPTQVKVRLHAAGVNPIDTKIRKNGLFYPDACPAILGCDGAGEIVELGDQVTGFQIGDAVWFCNGGLGREPGNYAEYTVLDPRWLAPKPQSVDYTEAAAAPLVLITAWGALFGRGGLQKGQTVLIHAGAGGVGHVAIQLARIAGARVITTVSDQQKAQWVCSLGADEIILYTQEDFVERTLQITQGKGADLIIDTVGPEVFKTSIAATAHFGAIVTLLDPEAFDFGEARMRNLKIGFELMLTPMLRDLPEHRDKHIEILRQCGQWMQQGKLKIHVSQCLPLEQASAAHALIEQGHSTGKVVLNI